MSECPGIHGTESAQSDFFASLKPSDGPGVRREWMCGGAPAVVS